MPEGVLSSGRPFPEFTGSDSDSAYNNVAALNNADDNINTFDYSDNDFYFNIDNFAFYPRFAASTLHRVGDQESRALRGPRRQILRERVRRTPDVPLQLVHLLLQHPVLYRPKTMKKQMSKFPKSSSSHIEPRIIRDSASSWFYLDALFDDRSRVSLWVTTTNRLFCVLFFFFACFLLLLPQSPHLFPSSRRAKKPSSVVSISPIQFSRPILVKGFPQESLIAIQLCFAFGKQWEKEAFE